MLSSLSFRLNTGTLLFDIGVKDKMIVREAPIGMFVDSIICLNQLKSVPEVVEISVPCPCISHCGSTCDHIRSVAMAISSLAVSIAIEEKLQKTTEVDISPTDLSLDALRSTVLEYHMRLSSSNSPDYGAANLIRAGVMSRLSELLGNPVVLRFPIEAPEAFSEDMAAVAGARKTLTTVISPHSTGKKPTLAIDFFKKALSSIPAYQPSVLLSAAAAFSELGRVEFTKALILRATELIKAGNRDVGVSEGFVKLLRERIKPGIQLDKKLPYYPAIEPRVFEEVQVIQQPVAEKRTEFSRRVDWAKQQLKENFFIQNASHRAARRNAEHPSKVLKEAKGISSLDEWEAAVTADLERMKF